MDATIGLDEYNVDALTAHLYDDWRRLINRRSAAVGDDRVELDAVYNRLLPYIIEIELSRSHGDLSLLGLVATAGRILQDSGEP